MQKQINNIEKQVVGLNKDVESINEKLDDHKVSMKAVSDSLKQFVDEAPNLFATKLSEKIVYGMVGIILVAVVSALLAGVVHALELIIK